MLSDTMGCNQENATLITIATRYKAKRRRKGNLQKFTQHINQWPCKEFVCIPIQTNKF
jgi:hypothetical protein